MTCHDAREQLSSLLDDALGVAERQALDAHLAACADCPRELEQLRATVALLGRIPAAHAPPGFVDRVMAAAYRPPWPRRLLDALFVPLRVKLPLEAAAALLVGVSALYVYQHAPEVREVAREESRDASPAPPVAPPTPSTSPALGAPGSEVAGKTTGSKDRELETKRAPSGQGTAREQTRQAPPAVAPTAPPAASTPESAAGQEAPAAQPTAKKEAQAERRRDAPAAATSPAVSDKVAQSAAPSASRHAAETGSRAGARAAPMAPPAVVPPAPPLRPSAVVPPAAAPAARDRVGAVAPAPPPAPTTESAPGEGLATAKPPVARQLMRAVDASGRLVVPAREPAEAALDALLGGLGATRAQRRLEGDRGMVIIDVLVPAARYRELIEGLGRIGRWVTDYEAPTLPARLRVEVALIIEP